MTVINSFRDLLVWQKSMNLAERCYGLSRRFPKQDQIVTEAEASLLVANAQEIGRMIHGLVRSLERAR